MPRSSSPSDNNLTYILPALQHAVSGSTGTVIATCTLYPLSLVIARLQVQRQLRQRQRQRRPAEPPQTSAASPLPQEAPKSAEPATTAQPPSSQDQSQHQASKSPDENQSPSGKGTTKSNGAASAATDAEYAGILDAFSRIYGEEGGLKALYSGLAQDAAKSLLDSFLFFMFYEWFRGAMTARRRRISNDAKRRLGVLEDLAVGMAAGACSRAFTTPIANVVTRKQTASLMGDEAAASAGDKSVMQILREIRKEKGIQGLWAGYSATLLLTLNPSITFFLQDFLTKTLLGPERWEDPGIQLTFLIAASSKAAASAITYPFQIAKTRLQAGVPVEHEDDDESSSTASTTEDKANGAHVNPNGSVRTDEAKTKAVKKKVESKLRALSAMRSFAKMTIFGQIAQIVNTEGIGALYDGIQGELLKGFFSHGTTMLAKNVVHKLLFKLYLFTIELLREWRARRRAAASKGGGGGGSGGGGTGGAGGVGKTGRERIDEILSRLKSRILALKVAGLSFPGAKLQNQPGTPAGGNSTQNLPPALQYRIPWDPIRSRAQGTTDRVTIETELGVINLVEGSHRVLAKE